LVSETSAIMVIYRTCAARSRAHVGNVMLVTLSHVPSMATFAKVVITAGLSFQIKYQMSAALNDRIYRVLMAMPIVLDAVG
jgi:hypothetical protein